MFAIRPIHRILLATASVALLLVLWFTVTRKPVSRAVIRVGVDQSPPFYLIQPDGTVRGLAVDILNEAARRANIRLQWIPLHDLPLEDALNQRRVDLWPLVGLTPERRRMFHVTKPWLESEYVLVSTRQAPVWNPDQAVGKVVAHARLRFTTLIAKQFLSRSVITVRHLRTDAVQALCAGEASAVLAESNTLDNILLTRPPGCENTEFQVANLTGASTPLAIAAVPEVAAAADKLRARIAEMAKDGVLTERLDRWSPFSAQGTRSILAEESANDRNGFYRYCLLMIALLGTGVAWVAYRSQRLRRKVERAEMGRIEIQRRFTAFMDNSPALAFMKDTAGRMLYVNRAWSQVFRMDPEDVYGKTDAELWPAATARNLRATDQALLAENQPRQVVEQVPVAGHGARDLLVVKFPFSNQQGQNFVGGTAIDITDREAAIRALEASETRHREMFEHNPLPAWVYDRETFAFLTVNEAAVQRYGWTREDFLTGMTLADVICADEMEFFGQNGANLDDAHCTRGSWHHQTKHGMRLSVDVTSYELEYTKRKARLTIMRDLTEKERMLEQLRIGEERWQLALRGAGDALWDWDLTKDHVYRSPRWGTMLGYKDGEIGETHEDFVKMLHPDDAEAALGAVQAYLKRKKTTDKFVAEYRLRHKDGSWRWVMDRGQAVWDERGIPVRMAGSHTDITERKAVESLLTLQARTDALTGIANRREFERLFGEHFRLARLNADRLTVCLCDLDRLKEVNDVYGHATGDRVLMAFAQVLKTNLRVTDLLARIGGDEFVISLPHTSAVQATAVVEKMRHELRSLSFEGSSGYFGVTSSFGLVELQSDHRDSGQLLADADRLLYDAKGNGRDRTLAG